MSDVRDPAIKLFGRKIPLPECQIPSLESDPECQIQVVSKVMDECHEATKIEAEDPPSLVSSKQDNPPDSREDEENNYQTPTEENKTTVDRKPKEDRAAETDLGCQEKVFKKPETILPCPRCNSLDTKFCYFNNYNVNQPRHFCKNCQRYWTAGGTMRNVPVGAGRRKNKHSSSHYRQVVVSSDTLNSSSHQVLSCGGLSPSSRPSKGTGEVLQFGADAPLCESMATALNLEDKKKSVETSSVAHGEIGEEPSPSGSSLTSTTFWENELPEKVIQMEQVGLPYNGFAPHPLQCYPGPPWAYPWNPNDMVYGPDSSNPNPVQWGSPPMVAVPGFCRPSMTFPFVPASYWGCMPGWDARKWNIPSVGSTGSLSPSSSTNNSGCSGNSLPTLGKHSRDANLQVEEKTEKFLWVPKTLRIDDPDEAAKSSIWATLGIKPDKNELNLKGGIFKAFQPKTEGSACTSDADQVLQANPAALSRSQTFQESS